MRRCALCIIDQVYRHIHTFGGGVGFLAPAARAELLTAAALVPLLVADLRAEFVDTVFDQCFHHRPCPLWSKMRWYHRQMNRRCRRWSRRNRRWRGSGR